MGQLQRNPEFFHVLGSLNDGRRLIESENGLDLLLPDLCLGCHLLTHHDWILVAGCLAWLLHLLLLVGALRGLTLEVLLLGHELGLLHDILALIRPLRIHLLLVLELSHVLLVLLLRPLLSILSLSLIILHI